MNVVALVKDTERYVFLYDDVSSSQMLQTLGQYAADKELSFTWYDAAVMSQKVRKLRREAEQEEQSRRLPKTAWNRDGCFFWNEFLSPAQVTHQKPIFEALWSLRNLSGQLNCMTR